MPAQNLPGLVLDRAHPLARGLVGWWPMNEGGGARLNNLVDPDGYALSVAATPQRGGGILGSSMGFGASAYALATVKGLPAGSAKRTLAVWARFASASASEIVFGYGSASTANSQINFYVSGNDLYCQIWTTGVYYPFPRGQKWNLLTAVMTGATMSTCRLYVDGKYRAGTLSGGDNTLTTTANNLTFGGHSGNPTNLPFTGSLAHARIYDRALSDAEVMQLYVDPLAGALAPSRAARFYVSSGFKAWWASRSNQIIGGGQ